MKTRIKWDSERQCLYDAHTGQEVVTPKKLNGGVPGVVSDYQPYKSPLGDGLVIEGRAAHREHLKRNGMRILEAGEIQQEKRERERGLAELRNSIDPTTARYGYRGEEHYRR